MASRIVQIFTFTMVIGTAFALTCYKCDSSENKLCSYGLASLLYSTVDCNQEFGGGSAFTNWVPKQCVKLVAQDSQGNEYTARGCMPHIGGSCNAIAKTLSFFGSLDGNVKDMQCSPCDTDKCNSAPNLRGYTLLGVLMAAFVFMF